MQRNIAHAIGLMIFGVLAAGVSAQTTPQEASATVLEDLKKAHHLLVHAIHDYDGHRAKATHEVHKAMKELGYTHKAGAAKSAPGTATKENQPASDAQLCEAQELLQKAESSLTGRHPKAHANVRAAIGEISTALKIK
jgi:hypothetical protein